ARAVAFELQWIGRGIADPPRPRALVARQPRQSQFGEPPLAVDAVHDLQLRWATGDGTHQPFAPIPRRVVEAAVHQTQQGEGCIPEPTKAIVPITRSAE